MGHTTTELWPLLKQVSRSFYLTLRVLPAPIRQQVGMAYLLARTTDTVADTALISVEERLEELRAMQTAIQAAAGGQETVLPDFRELAAAHIDPASGSRAERILVESFGATLQALKAFPLEDRARIRALLDIICSGQEMDLIRFAAASENRIAALETDAELEDYTYRVAGCVGEFWTTMCRAHLFPRAAIAEPSLRHNGVLFGQGLQLVNILRDLPRDLHQGRCYLPADRLAQHELRPQDLLDPANMDRFRTLYHEYLQLTEQNLMAGWHYVQALPSGHVRLRLACAWPALIGFKTIARLRNGNILDARTPTKVSRSEIRQLILRSVISYPSTSAWDRLIALAGESGNNPERTHKQSVESGRKHD